MNAIDRVVAQLAGGLLDASVKAFFVLLVAGAIVLLLRRRSAAMRHVVWTLAVVSVLLLPVFSLVMPRWRVTVLPAHEKPEPPDAKPAIVVANPQTLPQSAALPAAPDLIAPAARVTKENSRIVEDHSALAPSRAKFGEHGLAPTVKSATPFVRARSVPRSVFVTTPVLLVWGLGAFVVGLVRLLGIAAVRIHSHRAVRDSSSPLASLMDQLADELRIGRRVSLLLSDTSTMPMTWGVLRPRVMLPAVAVQWPTERAKTVLLHELSHVRRWDCFTLGLAHLACMLYWFNPLAWVPQSRMRCEQERACDDAVLAHGATATSYARDLLLVARTLRAGPFTSLAAVTMARPSQLRSRILAILDSQIRRGRITRRAVIATVIVTAAGLLPLSALRLAPRQSMAKADVAIPTTQPAGKTFVVRAVRSDNGNPVDGARGYYTLDGREFVKFELDAKGEARVQVPEKFRQLRLDLNKDGLVQYSVSLGDNPRGLPFTETYTAHMLPGTAIGGLVQDENGKPVEGVKVLFQAFYSLPDHPDKTCNGSGVAMTDAQGRWIFGGAPGEPQQMISIAAQHPDFLLSSSNQNLRMSQFAQLKKKELVTVIRRGISVPGTVTDKDGKPVAKARIGQDSLGLVNGTTSDEQAKFVLRGVESGKRQMMASADGYVAQEIDYTATAGDAKPLEFKLEKGKEIRGKVVDGNGKPISGVSISFVPFKQYPRMNSYAITQADGQFVWNGAPDTPVAASLYKQGYVRVGNQMWTAGTDVKIAMAESATGDPFERPVVLTARGTVVDAATGRPVENFQVLVSVHKAERPTMTWPSHGTGNNGRYSVPVSEPGDSFVVRIDAQGYLPFESPSLTRTQVEQYSVKLTPGNSMKGIVLQPDGKPAAGADVALREWYMLEVENGEIGMRRNTQQTHATKADADGYFQLPAREGRVRVFAVHSSGWGEWVVDGQGEAHEPLKMWNWSKVEGTVVEGGKPMAGKTVRIQVYGTASDSTDRAEYSARGFFRYETTTDAKGRFEFDRVIDGPGELQVEAAREGPLQRVENGYTAMLELKLGERRVMNFGGSGRPVVGKLSIPDDLKAKVQMPHMGRMSRVRPTFVAPAGYQDMSKEEKRKLQEEFHQTPAYQDYLNRPTGYGVMLQPDGTFRANDVPAGQYLLSFSVLADRPDANNFRGMLASVTIPVAVPDMPGGRSDEPLDVNKLELEPRNPSAPKPLELKEYRNVKVSDNAPAFAAMTLDGKPVKLADLRGKCVVVDFWATWCGPCIADMPNIQKLHEKYKDDPKVVVLGISLDERIDEPARFAKNRSLAWLQWYGGASGAQSAYTEFGIHGIPSVWIISPDGKVLARDLSGEAVAPALEKALKKE